MSVKAAEGRDFPGDPAAETPCSLVRELDPTCCN